MTTLIVTSKEDPASMNIRGHLLGMAEWKERGTFRGSPVLEHGDFLMVTREDSMLFQDEVHLSVVDTLRDTPLKGLRIDSCIFASRHRSEKNLRSLTVHPLGNFTEAKFGGVAGELSRTWPQRMTSSLRWLKKKADEEKISGYRVSFEATHHGPLMSIPSFFIEIGSDEESYAVPALGKLLAECILSVGSEAGENTGEKYYPVAVGVGGGHYMPRITDVALSRKVSFGHMLATYAVESMKDNPELLRSIVHQAVERSGAKLVYFHRKELKGSVLSLMTNIFADMGVEAVRSEELEGLP